MRIYVYTHRQTPIDPSTTRMVFISKLAMFRYIKAERDTFSADMHSLSQHSNINQVLIHEHDESLQVYEVDKRGTARTIAHAMAALGANVFAHQSVGGECAPRQVYELVGTDEVTQWIRKNR